MTEGVSQPCPDDDALQAWVEGRLGRDERARVAAHLTTCAECRAVVGEDGVAGPSSEPTFARIGRFVVLGTIGRGGMGEVLEAYDPRLDRRVALKLVRRVTRGDGATADALRTRLAREARAMARLHHPHVVTVFEVDELDGQVVVVMELVEGDTLARWLAAQPRGWREVVAAFVEAGEGLAAAHEVGIVHRDFKPDNVLVDRAGRVRVTDFGLALVDAEDDRTIAGTPAYMAPEQAAGRVVDARADVYSWSLALVRALGGEPGVAPTDLPEARLLASAPLVDGGRSTSRAAAPAWVMRVVERGLAEDPAARWPSMRDALTALAKDPRARWRRGAAALVIAGAIALGIGLGARAPDRCAVPPGELVGIRGEAVRAQIRAAFDATRAPFADAAWRGVERGLDAFAAGWEAMRREACEATHVRGVQSGELLDRRMACLDQRRAEVEALVGLFTRADRPLVERAAGALQQLEPLASCADLMALSLPITPPRPEQRAAVDGARRRLAGSKALGVAGRYADALAVARVVAAEARTAGYAPLVAASQVEVGRALGWSGEPGLATDALYEGMWAADGAHDDVLRVRAAIELAVLLGNRLGRFDEARRVLDGAHAVVTRLGGQAELESRILNARGQAAYKQGHYDEAEQTYRRALTLEANPTSAHTIAVRNNLANALFRRGDIERALEAHREVLALRLGLVGPDHPSIATSRNNLAIALLALGRFDEARAELEATLTIDRATVGDAHPRLVTTHTNLAIALVGLGDPEGALEHLARALAIGEAKLGPAHADLGAVLTERASAWLALERFGEARDDLERALTIERAALGEGHAMEARTRELRGALARRERRFADAVEELEAALAIEERSTRADSVTLAPLLVGLGEAHLGARDPLAALGPLERALALPAGGDPAVRAQAADALERARAGWLATGPSDQDDGAD